MAPRREHGLQADRGHAACVVAPHLAQASDARGPATSPQGTPQHPRYHSSILAPRIDKISSETLRYSTRKREPRITLRLWGKL